MIICLFYEFCFASLETKCFQLTIILDGQVSGILASDGSFADLSIVPYEINLVWNNGKVSKASITSKNTGNLTVKYNGKLKTFSFKAGETKLIK